jgi:hypothetical protein
MTVLALLSEARGIGPGLLQLAPPRAGLLARAFTPGGDGIRLRTRRRAVAERAVTFDGAPEPLGGPRVDETPARENFDFDR